MKISVHGWARNMGTDVLTNINLKELDLSDDRYRIVSFNRPGLFRRYGTLFIAWCQKFRHMGNYRMEIELQDEDVMHLFKSRYGMELTPWFLDHEGFTVSPELKKRILSTIKLTDVTLGQLLTAMHASSNDETITADKLIDESSNVTRLNRRV